jgi:hypothetical protein
MNPYFGNGGGSLLPYGLPWYCEDSSEDERRGEEQDAHLDFESQWRTFNNVGSPYVDSVLEIGNPHG